MKKLTTLATILGLALACDAADLPVDTDVLEADTDTDADTDADTDTDTDADIATCSQLCSQAGNATPSEGSCAAQWFTANGYNLLPYQECAAIAGNEPGCNACMASLGASDGDCAAVADECL